MGRIPGRTSWSVQGVLLTSDGSKSLWWWWWGAGAFYSNGTFHGVCQKIVTIIKWFFCLGLGQWAWTEGTCGEWVNQKRENHWSHCIRSLIEPFNHISLGASGWERSNFSATIWHVFMETKVAGWLYIWQLIFETRFLLPDHNRTLCFAVGAYNLYNMFKSSNLKYI